MQVWAVHTTLADEASAQRIAEEAVRLGLAACVQQERIHSTYLWQGALQSDPEIRLLFKTTEAAYPRLEALVHALHPYTLPAVFALPVVAGSDAYLDWVRQSVAPAGVEPMPRT